MADQVEPMDLKSTLSKRIEELDSIREARIKLQIAARINNMRSVPTHVLSTIGWLFLNEDDTQEEVLRLQAYIHSTTEK